MKLARIEYNDKKHYVEISESTVTSIHINNNNMREYEKGEVLEDIDINSIKFLPPSNPTKIVCVGLNYIDHARELNLEIPDNPIIFLKPPSSLTSHNGNIILPPKVGRVDYEGELAVVIAKEGKNIKKEDIDEYILGITCFNDVTARDIQKKDGQWTRAKSYDTFASVGPWIETEVNIRDYFQLQTLVNGEIVQTGNTKNFIFDIPTLVSFISNVMTLKPGDIIATGTPPGVGPIKSGDIVEVKIDNIGTLRNLVV